MNPRYPLPRRWYMLLFLLPLVLFVTAGAGHAQSAPKMTLKVGASDRPDQAALYLSLYRGYFEKEGLAVDLIQLRPLPIS